MFLFCRSRQVKSFCVHFKKFMFWVQGGLPNAHAWFFFHEDFFFLISCRELCNYSNQSFFATVWHNYLLADVQWLRQEAETPLAIQVQLAFHITVISVNFRTHTRTQRRMPLHYTALSHDFMFLECITSVHAWCHFWLATVLSAGAMQPCRIKVAYACQTAVAASFCDRMPK